MMTRVISGVILGAVAVAMILLGGIPFGILVALFAAIGLYEFYRVFEKKDYHPMKWIGILFFAMMIPSFFFKDMKPLEYFVGGYPVNLVTGMQLVIMLCILSLLVLRHEKYTVTDGAITLFGGYYVTFLLSFFTLLRNMQYGAFLFLLALIGAVAADTFALIFGLLWGKHKLIPAVSPKKTVEGSVGAFVGSVGVLFLYQALWGLCGLDMPDISWYWYLIVGVLIGAMAQIGDLAASAMKRYTGVKDFGKLIPGHGGVLDRIDSYLYVVPVVYYFAALYFK